jgi:hypothetical protein
LSRFETFEQFLTNQSAQVDVGSFVINLLLAAGLAWFLARLYVRYGDALSNRRLFARNFVLLAVTTMFIITVVKSSLALSLGLVGALSIVRFRAAIKEPEELSYLFLTIAMGLGLGADQRGITLVAFAGVALVIWLKHYSRRAVQNQNLYLSVEGEGPVKVALEDVVRTLEQHCTSVNLKRFDETDHALEAAFLVEFDDFDQVSRVRAALQSLSEHLKIRFLDLKAVHG